jgi:hypothetical protein
MNLAPDYLIIDGVLEQVKNPIDFLSDVSKFVKVGTLIHILVPPIDALFSGFHSVKN